MRRRHASLQKLLSHDPDWVARQELLGAQDTRGSKQLVRRKRPRLPHGFEFTRGLPVAVVAGDERPACGLCGHPLCMFHEEHFSDCPCPGPQSGLDDGWAIVCYPDDKLVAWPVRRMTVDV